MRDFYIAIAEVYQDVAQATPVFEGNPCGECRSCCSSIMAHHRVTDLELATMAFHLGPERVEPFRRFLARERDEKGEIVFSTCPNLDQHGCSVHAHRPLACRLYGHFRARSAELIEHCVFRGHETVFPDEQEHRLSPGAARLAELSIEYLSYFPNAGSAGGRVYENWETDLEQASYLKVTGDLAEARAVLLKLRASDASPIVLLMLAECHEGLADYAAALATLEDAIAGSPGNPELHSARGRNLLWAGRLDEARRALQEALDLAPDRPITHGLLGFVHQLKGDPACARSHLSLAVQGESEPGPYRYQLALALQALGERQACREMLERAREFEPTRQQAEQALAALG